MNATQDLETLALDAHRRGLTWAEFWPAVAADVAKAEAHGARRYHRLVGRLVALVAAGDVDGQQPIAASWGQPEAWELDDQTQPVPVIVVDDATTAARYSWPRGQETTT